MIIALTVLAIIVFLVGAFLLFMMESTGETTIPIPYFLMAIFFLILALLWKINPFW